MLKYLFAFLLFIHGLIHLMGFVKAYGYGNVNHLTKEISKPLGAFWLITTILFLTTVVLFLLKKGSWPPIVMIAAVVSQVLIITVWKDAKFGSIANAIVLMVAISAWSSQQFEATFIKDVKSHLLKSSTIQTDLLTEDDIQSLPSLVQKYIRYSGAVNKPKVKNMKIVFDGEMREKGKDYFKFTSVQYNFFDEPTRLFFMKAKIYGAPVPGYHCYQNASATMQIKLLGIFNVVNIKGAIMNKAETVTVFNDMCLMAPAALIDKRIEWTTIDSLSVKATFTNGVNRIAATLYFNELGQLINFISDDRSAIDMKQYRFSTPVNNYVEKEGRKVMSYGETIWHYPDGEFVYGKFTLNKILYNVTEFNP